jgi:hypothetical protein
LTIKTGGASSRKQRSKHNLYCKTNKLLLEKTDVMQSGQSDRHLALAWPHISQTVRTARFYPWPAYN